MVLRNNCLTTKQAKAAYKARDSVSVTPSILRQLQRSNELERRAELLREREQRRKVQKQKVHDKPRARPLGTQRTVDKFGHRSSQFHLLNFVKKDKAETNTNRSADAEPATANVDSARHPESQTTCLADLEVLADCQTQVAREIANDSLIDKVVVSTTRSKVDRTISLSFDSFTSDDMFLDQDDVDRLDAAAAVDRAEKSRIDSMRMPPPSAQRRRPTENSMLPGLRHLPDSGIGFADLEDLADLDVVLTPAHRRSFH